MENSKQFKLPPYWVRKVSKSRGGKTYYFNTRTNKSVWKLHDVEAAEKKENESRKSRETKQICKYSEQNSGDGWFICQIFTNTNFNTVTLRLQKHAQLKFIKIQR